MEVAYRMSERWRQENFFKYMREEFLLDGSGPPARLVDAYLLSSVVQPTNDQTYGTMMPRERGRSTPSNQFFCDSWAVGFWEDRPCSPP